MGRVRSALIALALVALTTAIKAFFPPVGRDLPFILYFGSVLAAALEGGRGSGILATVAAAVCANVFFLTPQGQPSGGPVALLQTAVFVAEGAAIAVVCGALRGAREKARADAATERQAREQAEAAQRELRRVLEERTRAEEKERFLEEASELLSSSLDYDQTLTALAHLSVPRIADWASVDMLEPDASFRRVALAHSDPAQIERAGQLWRTHKPGPDEAPWLIRVLRDGEPALFESITDQMIASSLTDPERASMLRSLGLCSSMILPLRAGGRVVGIVSLLSAESGRRFGQADLAFAEELARRASTAVAHAMAYRESIEANRVKDEFLATISHELRTPLNAILGWAALLRAGTGVDPAKAVATIERNARAQARLIEDVLDVSRIVTGKLTVERRPIDVAPVLRAAVDSVAPAAEAKGLSLTTVIDADPCPMMGDADRLRQVCWNLLSNAVKFTPKGGRVVARLGREAGSVVISVEDDGVGFKPEFLPHLFERFRQADSSPTRLAGGLGLGLALVRHLVEMHGGQVEAASEGEGKGARFTVVLPAGNTSPPEGRPSTSGSSLGQGKRRLEGRRLVVCDDDADARDLLRHALESEGATVRVTASADEAVAEVRESRPDALVSDIGLPVVDGYELLRRLRALPVAQGGRTPALALTAYASADDAQKAREAGFDAHLAKPAAPDEVVATVARLVS